MTPRQQILYACPETKQSLQLVEAVIIDGLMKSGFLLSPNGRRYPIIDGMPDFVSATEISGGDKSAIEEYDRLAATYDADLPITFETVGEDELAGRRKMISKLELSSSAKVLEIGCGTGRDTVLLAEQLGAEGHLFAQDLSLPMLVQCREKFAQQPLQVELARASGSALPFPADFFDAVYHFGGLNTFTFLDKALQEMCRVTREGGKIVVGDESVAPWLRSTLIGKILMHNNPLYAYKVPLTKIPENTRDVSVEWVFGGFFYVITMTVTKQERQINIDLPIPGKRGGTHRTRYFGQLEGVTIETKQLAQSAAEASGKSLHRWLEETIKGVAQKQLMAKPE